MSGVLDEDVNGFRAAVSDLRGATRNRGNGFSIYYVVDRNIWQK